MPRTVIAAALGECVHVADINDFLSFAEATDTLSANGIHYIFAAHHLLQNDPTKWNSLTVF